MAEDRQFRKRLAKFGIESEFVNGLRKTSEEVLDVVEMVLAGRINKEIVRKIQQSGAKSIGLIRCRRQADSSRSQSRMRLRLVL